MENLINYKRKTIINVLSLPTVIIIICVMVFFMKLQNGTWLEIFAALPLLVVCFILWNLKIIDDLIVCKKNKKFVLLNVTIFVIYYVLLIYIFYFIIKYINSL